MPVREHVLLSDAERAALFGIPTDPDDLARRFTLEKPDLDLIGQRRHDRNRLGMALQFTLIRYPGMTLAQMIQIEGGVPHALAVFVARQLSLDPCLLADYATRSQTMTDHARLIAASLDVRPPVRGDIALMIASAERAASATDAALPIATAVVEALRAANILLPMSSTIERAGVAGRARARKHAVRLMVAHLSPVQIGRIDALFDEQDGERLGWLKTIPIATKTDSVRDIVERLRVVRAIGIPHDAGSGRTDTDVEAKALSNRIDGLMPRIRITELLHDVASETGFLAAFTNLRTGRRSDNPNALLAAILADGTNLGLARMAAASQGVTRDQLVWTKDAYVREDGYHRALAILIDAHSRLPIASTWGTGTTSSSDGQFFRGGKRMAVGDINARYGVDPGFSFYTHVSDQHAPYHVTVISAATHEAPYVLDGLLHHGSSLKIGEHYTDTGGATDHVFALCAMLGFRFCPRLRDFPDRRLAALGPAASYPAIGSLLGKRLKTDTIREHWGEVLRLVASLKAGHVAPSAMLRKLAAYERQNQVDLALQEIGRIERTFFMLDWLENLDLRRRCQAGLNKSEQRHVLTQAICTFRQGRIIDRTHETLQYRASGLNLVIAAIVYWNSTYIADAVQHLRSIGEAPDPALLAHTSPVGWEHIAFSGDFLWDRAAETVRRKPLNVASHRYPG